MTLKTIGTGIKTRLETISGLRVFAPNELPDSINQFPCALILPGDVTYDATFDDAADLRYRILLLVSKQDSPSAFNKLLDYLEVTGTYSVKAAIEADSTLGGTASDCRVSNNKGASSTVWGGHMYLSTEFELLVWT